MNVKQMPTRGHTNKMFHLSKLHMLTLNMKNYIYNNTSIVTVSSWIFLSIRSSCTENTAVSLDKEQTDGAELNDNNVQESVTVKRLIGNRALETMMFLLTTHVQLKQATAATEMKHKLHAGFIPN